MVEVNSALDSNIRGLPALFSTIVTFFPATHIGLTFVYRLEVFNTNYATDGLSSLSRTSSFVLANIPDVSSSAGPTEIVSTNSSISVQFSAMSSTL